MSDKVAVLRVEFDRPEQLAQWLRSTAQTIGMRYKVPMHANLIDEAKTAGVLSIVEKPAPGGRRE